MIKILFCIRYIGIIVFRRIHKKNASSSISLTCNARYICFKHFSQFSKQTIMLYLKCTTHGLSNLWLHLHPSG